jgi:hypothetical protein
MPDPTAREDELATQVRAWYEANRETFLTRVTRRGDEADNFSLRLIKFMRGLMFHDRNRRYRRTPVESNHPLVRLLWEKIDESPLSLTAISRKAGFTHSTLEKWRNGSRLPSLMNIEAAFGALGYTITVTAIKEPER